MTKFRRLFEEFGATAVATLKVRVGRTAHADQAAESQLESRSESLRRRVLGLLEAGPLGKAELSARLGQTRVSGQLNKIIRDLLREGLVEYTLPESPNSRPQNYRLILQTPYEESQIARQTQGLV